MATKTDRYIATLENENGMLTDKVAELEKALRDVISEASSPPNPYRERDIIQICRKALGGRTMGGLTLEPVNAECCRNCAYFSQDRVWKYKHHEDFLGHQYNCHLFGKGFHDEVTKYASWNGDAPSNCRCIKFERK